MKQTIRKAEQTFIALFWVVIVLMMAYFVIVSLTEAYSYTEFCSNELGLNLSLTTDYQKCEAITDLLNRTAVINITTTINNTVIINRTVIINSTVTKNNTIIKKEVINRTVTYYQNITPQKYLTREAYEIEKQRLMLELEKKEYEQKKKIDEMLRNLTAATAAPPTTLDVGTFFDKIIEFKFRAAMFKQIEGIFSNVLSDTQQNTAQESDAVVELKKQVGQLLSQQRTKTQSGTGTATVLLIATIITLFFLAYTYFHKADKRNKLQERSRLISDTAPQSLYHEAIPTYAPPPQPPPPPTQQAPQTETSYDEAIQRLRESLQKEKSGQVE